MIKCVVVIVHMFLPIFCGLFSAPSSICGTLASWSAVLLATVAFCVMNRNLTYINGVKSPEIDGRDLFSFALLAFVLLFFYYFYFIFIILRIIVQES